MPFKVSEAKKHVNRVLFTYNGQKLELHYNAGDKYAQMEEQVEKKGLDRLGEEWGMTPPEIRDEIEALREKLAQNGTMSASDLRYELGEIVDQIGDAPDQLKYNEIRRLLAEIICMVTESWDLEDENGHILPVNAKKFAELGLPLDFYNGLSNKIAADYASRGGGTKRRS